MNKLATRVLYGFKTSVYNDIDISSTHKINVTYFSIKANNLVIKKSSHLKPLPSFDAQTLGFGLNDTDHLFSVRSNKGVWSNPEIKPLEPIPIHPFNSSLHYAVQCFEGMKAYKDRSGKIRLFRP